MRSKPKDAVKTFDSALTYFRAHGFDVQEMPGVAGQMQIRKYGCGVVLARKTDGGIATVVRSGCIVGGEISRLIDRGYQKFLTTSRLEVGATADHLQALHGFQEELDVAIGKTDYYNLALGTVSDLYLYDRLKGRDLEAKPTNGSH